ncbi:LiaI-LiaF-like domain-containing protein [Chromobacterium sp. IIBBL 290-4]|uniref:LiaI-LiaF-like domain-containing protein n=1 Tax=Chromobacterium sp. IIBBL 290-4 TaxID=2953890 RepID=UPI0020B66422|nr:DUF5668 domain-containing protein [Chromobacterium sp. IIBBL 290-4]UTH73547.1 cell wall-active antibiotics response protein [Chromobacterium sp. IIBBL 290-4]
MRTRRGMRHWHDQDFRQPPARRIGFGLFVIVVGVLILLNNLNVFNVFGALQFWPVFFILVGAMQFFHRGQPFQYVFGGGLMTLGGLLILRQAGYLSFNLHDWWPVLLIFAGVMVIMRGFRRSLPASWSNSEEHAVELKTNVIMGGGVVRNDSQEFKGGEVSVIMGGLKLDLTQAVIQQEAVLKLDVLLGGLEILVPHGWSVKLEATSIMGAVEDKTVPGMSGGQLLIVRGNIIMSGVEIRN